MHSTATTLFALAGSAMGHYNFEALIVNGVVSKPYEYVRSTKNFNYPITDVSSKDMVCNNGSSDADIMVKTNTKTVKPGDEVGFTVNPNLGHPGPLAVYMSKAPGKANEYDGSGDWFKVYALTTSGISDSGLQWATFVNGGVTKFTFALPKELPAGEYLMRAEHLGLHGAQKVGGAQFYIGCAQLSVGGSGGGVPGPKVRFPGAYKADDPGILISLYSGTHTSYIAPGPVTWPNACEDHTANSSGQESDGDCTGSDGKKPAGAG